MKRLILIGAVGLAIVAGITLWQTRGGSTPLAEFPAGAANAQEASDVDISIVQEMSMGNPDAKVTVTEYASFTCPHCARFHEGQFKELKADYIDTNQINFVYRDVFFDRYGLWASMVARCGGQDRFFGIADMIYEQQRDWIGDGQDPVAIADRLRTIGKVAGLGSDQLEACLNDNDKAKALVAWYQQNAEADGIRSTPTLVINGTSYNNMAYDELKALIDEELAK
ncbi:MAG: DsbA family protein [Roseovarius sp.]